MGLSNGTPVQFTLPPNLTLAERAAFFATLFAATEAAAQNAPSVTNTRTSIRQREEVKKTKTQSSKQLSRKKNQAPEDDEVMFVSSGRSRPAAPA